MDALDSVYGGDVGFIKIDVEGHEQAVLDGAVADDPRAASRACWSRSTSACRQAAWPAPRPISRTSAIAATSSTAGRHRSRSSLFSTDRLQKPGRSARTSTAPLQQRQRFGRYIYNFIFLPPDEPTETLRQMSKRLSQL